MSGVKLVVGRESDLTNYSGVWLGHHVHHPLFTVPFSPRAQYTTTSHDRSTVHPTRQSTRRHGHGRALLPH